MSLDQFYHLMDLLPGDEDEKLSLATKAASLRYPVKGWLPEREAAKELGEKLEAYKALGFKEGTLEDYSFECC